MKRIGITQRVDIVARYNERRDSLDQEWGRLFTEMGVMMCPLPNAAPHLVDPMLDILKLDGLVFSGGNSITSLDPLAGDSAPERDAFEQQLFLTAIARDIPIVGICRGMQHINLLLGGKLARIKGHIATRHVLVHTTNTNDLSSYVNSFHSWGIPKTGLAPKLNRLAIDTEGWIEAYNHNDQRILGLMWHPEREKPFHDIDLNLMKTALL